MFILSCTNDDQPKPPFEEVFRKVDISKDKNVAGLINNLGSSGSSARTSASGTFTTAMGELKLDEIIERISSETQPGPHYTIALIPPPDVVGTIEWLVLVAKSDGYIGYILQFEPNGATTMANYSGYIRILGLERNVQAESFFEGGKEVDLPTNARTDEDDKTCKCVYEFEASTTTGWDLPQSLKVTCQCTQSGSGGGGADDEHDEGTDFLVIGNPIVDPDSGSGSGGDGSGGGTGTADPDGIAAGGGTGETIGIIDPLTRCGQGETWNGERCLSAADVWESDKITLSEAFKNDPCLMEIWDAAMQTDAGFNLLAAFLQDYPAAELKMGVLYTPKDANNAGVFGALGAYGISQNYHQEQYVYLNFYAMPNASNIFIAAVLGHELIHASMMEDIYSKTALIQDNEYSHEDMQNNFPLVYDLWISEGFGPEGASHELMATHYRDQLKNFMREMDILMNGSAVNEGLYDTLSWIGLDRTLAYKEKVAAGELNESEINRIKNEQLSKGKCY